jgi:hypothetical protein
MTSRPGLLCIARCNPRRGPVGRSGTADLPLHGGRVPAWLSERMVRLGRVITEAIVREYGRDEFLRRLAHPFWFQSFGAVMGMDVERGQARCYHWLSESVTSAPTGRLKGPGRQLRLL